ncbi:MULTISPECIES: fluoride efflux transporter FluC [Frankia]|uniref:fluoride efflux transporter FluC n=1 Tax=Frankia TaxID=1854 RepID=UPI00030AE6A7|nr:MULTISPECIES: CrcB family protein [Frankia]
MAERPAPRRTPRARPAVCAAPAPATAAPAGTGARAEVATDPETTVDPEDATDAADPDVDLHLPAQRAELRAHPVPLLGVIAAGGALGACARYGAALAWPTQPGAFGWTTVAVNAVGCAAIGVLMALLAAGHLAHPLARPFLGTGILGGFTTFSTYAVDVEGLLDDGRPLLALAALVLTPTVALAAVWAATAATRRLLRPGQRRR